MESERNTKRLLRRKVAIKAPGEIKRLVVAFEAAREWLLAGALA